MNLTYIRSEMVIWDLSNEINLIPLTDWFNYQWFHKAAPTVMIINCSFSNNDFNDNFSYNDFNDNFSYNDFNDNFSYNDFNDNFSYNNFNDNFSYNDFNDNFSNNDFNDNFRTSFLLCSVSFSFYRPAPPLFQMLLCQPKQPWEASAPSRSWPPSSIWSTSPSPSWTLPSQTKSKIIIILFQ